MATMSVNEMRLILRDAYPGKGWKYKVMHLMKENQVIAVYASYMERKEKEKNKRKEEGHWEQMTLEGYFNEKACQS